MRMLGTFEWRLKNSITVILNIFILELGAPSPWEIEMGYEFSNII